jgi:hypothetical protein
MYLFKKIKPHQLLFLFDIRYREKIGGEARDVPSAFLWTSLVLSLLGYADSIKKTSTFFHAVCSSVKTIMQISCRRSLVGYRCNWWNHCNWSGSPPPSCRCSWSGKLPASSPLPLAPSPLPVASSRLPVAPSPLSWCYLHQVLSRVSRFRKSAEPLQYQGP